MKYLSGLARYRSADNSCSNGKCGSRTILSHPPRPVIWFTNPQAIVFQLQCGCHGGHHRVQIILMGTDIVLLDFDLFILSWLQYFITWLVMSSCTGKMQSMNNTVYMGDPCPHCKKCHTYISYMRNTLTSTAIDFGQKFGNLELSNVNKGLWNREQWVKGRGRELSFS